MIWSNFGISFSLIQWIFIIILSILLVYIGLFDYRERRIPNNILYWIIIVCIFWNIYALYAGGNILFQNFGELLFISVAGYNLSLSWKIWSWDIKLVCILACFFLTWNSPLIFIGNIASLTFFLLSIYIAIMFLFIDLSGLKVIFRTLHINTKNFLFLIWNISSPNICRRLNFIQLLKDIILYGSMLFFIILVQFFVEKSLIPFFHFLFFLSSGIGKIFLFIALFVSIKKLYLSKHRDSIRMVILWFFIFSFWWGYQNSLINEMLLHIQDYFIFMLIIGFISYIIIHLYTYTLRFFHKEEIPVRSLSIGDMVDVNTTKLYWEKSFPDKEQYISQYMEEALGISIPSGYERTIFIKMNKNYINALLRIKKKYALSESKVVIQKTLPYGIYIIAGFFFTLLSDIHLARLILNMISIR